METGFFVLLLPKTVYIVKIYGGEGGGGDY